MSHLKVFMASASNSSQTGRHFPASSDQKGMLQRCSYSLSRSAYVNQ